MNKEEPYRDQAERLRRRIEKINEQNLVEQDNLPPREQIHRQKRKKTKMKIKYPVIRLLVLSFVLLPIIIFSMNSYFNDKTRGGAEKTTAATSGYETVKFEETNTDQIVEEAKEEEQEEAVVEVDMAVESEQNEEVTTPENVPVENGAESSETPASTNNTETTNPQSKIILHTVQPGENLFRISMKYYNSKAGEEIIKKANKLLNENVYAGQVLKIPLEN
jgi:LysM repeat protein